MLVTSTIVFGSFTLLKATATSVPELAFWQFVAGLGIAGATPNAVALISEYAPARLRATLTTIALSGFLIGSTIGGLISAFLIPAYGWQSVFYVGGIAPLLMIPILLTGVPEFVRFLLLRGASQVRVGDIVRRIVPKLELGKDTTYVIPERAKGFPFVELFRGGRATTTILLWITMFMTLLVTYFLLSWLPVLINSAGLSVQQSVLASTMFPAGGVLGALLWGKMIDRYWPPAVLAMAYALFALGHGCNRPEQRVVCSACCGAVWHRDRRRCANGNQCIRWGRLSDPDEGNRRRVDARDWKNRVDDRSTAGRRNARATLVGG